MTRSFVAASSQYLEVAAAPVTAAPFTLSAWVKIAANVAEAKTVLAISQDDTGDICQLYAIQLEGGAWTEQDGVSSADMRSGTQLTLNAWQHLAVRYTTSSSRSLWVNGVQRDTDVVTIAPAGLNTLSVGRKNVDGDGDYMDGLIAEVAVWDVALAGADIADLASGTSPMALATLPVRYWRLKDNGDLTDLVAASVLTNSGSTWSADHPTVDDPPATGRRGGFMLMGMG